MATKRRRSFGNLVRCAVKEMVVPTSMGLGLALGGCGSSGDKSDVPMFAVMPPSKDAAVEYRDGYAIMPPKDAKADTRQPDTSMVFAIMPASPDAAPDTRDARPDTTPIYAIMPMRTDAAADAQGGDAAKPDSLPDAKPLPKDTGPIYAIMPLAVMPPNRG
jgi:hypothetical protein